MRRCYQTRPEMSSTEATEISPNGQNPATEFTSKPGQKNGK